MRLALAAPRHTQFSPHRRPLFLLALACACLVVLTSLVGCDAQLPFQRPAHGNRLPDAQQIMRPLEIGPANGYPGMLDPVQDSDDDMEQLIYPMLITLGEDLRPIPWAAKNWDISSDGLTYTFHLRDHLQWSDGTPITADDFAYTINRYLDPCTYNTYYNYLTIIKGATAFNNSVCPLGATASTQTLIGTSIVAADPQTLRLTLESPAGYFLAALSRPATWATPRALVHAHPTDWTDHLADGGGFGGNLYKLVQWDHQGHLAFERNDRFWGQKPLLRRIEYQLSNDIASAWTLYTSGQGDVGYPPLDELAAAKTLSGSSYREIPLLGLSYLRLNGALAPFDDVQVRKAFWLALDRRTLIHDVFLEDQDGYMPTIHLVPQGMPEYNVGLVDPVGRTGDAALDPDLADAHALATAYAAEKCAGQFANCPAIGYYLPRFDSSESYKRLSQSILAQWKAAFPGWRFEALPSGIQNPPPPAFIATLWGADYPDAQDFFSLLRHTGVVYNDSKVDVLEADALEDQADASRDPAQRQQFYQTVEQLLVNQVAAIPLWQPKVSYVLRARVGGGWYIGPDQRTPLSTWQRVYIRD